MSCRAQAASFDKIHKQLSSDGVQHRWLGLHGATALPIRLQNEIDKQTSFALLQEEKSRGPRGPIGAKTRHGVFVYDAKGVEQLHIEDQRGAQTASGAKTLTDKLTAALQTK